MANTHNDLARSTAAGDPGTIARAIGGGTLTVAAGEGVKFTAPTPTVDAPMRLVVYRLTDPTAPTFVTLLKVTGVTIDVLTIDGSMDGHADAAVQVGDAVANVPTGGDLRDLWTAIATISLTPGPQGDPGATGTPGTPGTVWREGSGAPNNALGVDGDLYLDGTTGDVYQRTAGAYAIVANIKGPTGATGTTGNTGATGSTGSAGAPGSVWREGSGAPSNAIGVDGDLYLDGATSDVYQRSAGVYTIVANIKGATGATGTAGSTGPPGVGSFGLSMPAGFSVTNSPLTGNGVIAVTTTLSGVLKGTGTALAAATAGTDYVSPSGLTTALAGYVDLTSAQAITGVKSFNAVTISDRTTPTVRSTITSTSTEITLEQTGAVRPTRLTLVGGSASSGGANGAIFENLDSGLPLVDFGFNINPGGTVTTRSIRLEGRGNPYSLTGSPEFQIGTLGTGLGTIYASDKKVAVSGAMCVYSAVDTGSAPNATLDVRGGVCLKRTAVTSTPFTVLVTHYLLGVTGPASARSIVLPSTAVAGQQFVVVDEAGNAATNNITVTVAGSGTINGASSYVLNANYGSVGLYCAGSGAWFVDSKV